MTGLRIGMIGVGRWAQQLRRAFEAEGGKVVAHARSGASPEPGCGSLIEDWRNLVGFDDLDLVIAATNDPELNTRAVELCAEHCRPVLCAKPLLRHPGALGAPVFVDLWRSFSTPWAIFRREIGKRYDRITIECCGAGPDRGYAGALDYGPHALAMLDELASRAPVYSEMARSRAMIGSRDTCRFSGAWGHAEFGNGYPRRSILASVRCPEGEHTFLDAGEELVYAGPSGVRRHESRGLALRRFARHVALKIRKFDDFESNPQVLGMGRPTFDVSKRVMVPLLELVK